MILASPEVSRFLTGGLLFELKFRTRSWVERAVTTAFCKASVLHPEFRICFSDHALLVLATWSHAVQNATMLLPDLGFRIRPAMKVERGEKVGQIDSVSPS